MENLSDLSIKTSPLNEQEAIHLLRRTTFVNSWKSIQTFIGKTADEAVDILLNNAKNAKDITMPNWIDASFENPWKKPEKERQAASDLLYKTIYEQNYELKRWWLEAMTADEISIREKMTLFWHGHFATKFAIDQVMPAQLMWRQNELFRKNHQGNFTNLVKQICYDGAMVIFLNTQDSTKNSPNENFSRELLELYTTGIGHYTETDVKEGAKVFTGIRTNFFSDEYTQYGVYKPFVLVYEHDNYDKNYLGSIIKGGNYNTPEEIFTVELADLVNIIFKNRTKEVATFICQKLYKYFVYSNDKKTNITVIDNLAATFIENNFEIRPVLAQLLKSEFFFDNKNIGIQIKTPAETVAGFTKHFNVKGDWKEWVMVTMGQELLNPPNVAGWPGYRKWADTRTYPFAVQQLSGFIWNQDDAYIIKWVQQFPDYEYPVKLINNIAKLFLAKPISAAQEEKYKKILMAGSPDYEWPSILKLTGTASNRIKQFLIRLIKAPNFHLS
jgi:uncharacterized protein (DUF1800 family)